jgi:hydroxymethylglutaryl-CoA reductase (NADPH)
LVITVGFDKPYLLAKAILCAQEPSMDPSRQHSTSSSIPLSVRRKVMIGIDAASPTLLKNYAFEIAILSMGALTGSIDNCNRFF